MVHEVGLIENEPISKRRLILCPAIPVLIFFAIENSRRRRGSVSDNRVNRISCLWEPIVRDLLTGAGG
jgi:hypothetical protein